LLSDSHGFLVSFILADINIESRHSLLFGECAADNEKGW